MSMNTITLDNGIYNSVAAYARLHNMSVSEAVKTGMQVFLEIIGKNNIAASRLKYYINPKVKALEMGFQCPDDLSLDYKKEWAEILEEKYL